jgi:prepilin-type N-terminal cleavage/methylation domain-containing protein
MRRGLTLLELVVALAVTGLVGAVAADALRRQLRAQLVRTLSASQRAGLHAAGELLVAQLRGVDVMAGDLRLAGDTAIDVLSTVAVGRVCGSTEDGIHLDLADSTALASFAYILDTPAAGDVLHLLVDSAGTAVWRERRILALTTPQPACARSLRLLLQPSAPESVLVIPSDAPARVRRWRRWVTYRAADGAWWLGERPCSAPGHCAGVQPAAGPLAPAGEGMQVELEDAAVVVRLRAASNALLATPETLTVRIARRGAMP